MLNNIKIGNKIIGENQPCFIIAELSANHNQSYEIAVETIKAAARAGADAIKLQTYTADTITIKSDKEYFQIKSGTIWDGTTLYELYQKAYTPWEWQPQLNMIADDLGLICFSSPFDKSAVDFLEEMEVPAYKIASFEIKDIPLIRYVASKNKPILFSVGIAEIEDIEEVIKACYDMNNHELILLKCTSSYPAMMEDANLSQIKYLRDRFDIITGLSDHTLGIVAPIVSIAFGAKIIEKHFILDKSIGGPDAAFSLDPVEFKLMVDTVREAEKAIGQEAYFVSEISTKGKIYGRSLFVVKDILKGESFTNENVRSIRPAYGLLPKFIDEIIGKKATRNLQQGEPLGWDMIE